MGKQGPRSLTWLTLKALAMSSPPKSEWAAASLCGVTQRMAAGIEVSSLDYQSTPARASGNIVFLLFSTVTSAFISSEMVELESHGI